MLLSSMVKVLSKVQLISSRQHVLKRKSRLESPTDPDLLNHLQHLLLQPEADHQLQTLNKLQRLLLKLDWPLSKRRRHEIATLKAAL